MSYFLAIDVGFRSSGLALFEMTGENHKLIVANCFSYKKEKKSKEYVSVADVKQLIKMALDIAHFIDRWMVKDIAVELPTGGAKSSRASRLMGMASAMIAVIALWKKANINWLTPKDIKKAATGRNHAEKDEIMAAMGKLYPEINKIPKCRREHIADAIACFLAYQKKQREGQDDSADNVDGQHNAAGVSGPGDPGTI